MNIIDYICLTVAALTVFASICLVLNYRRKTRNTLNHASRMIDDAISGNFGESVFDESMLSSVENKLSQFLSACSVSSKNLADEKNKIKELIADISHQTKTPISNILLYTQLLNEHSLPEESVQCVSALSEQAEKLSFLIETLVKTSRLETGIITLNPKPSSVQILIFDSAAQLIPKADSKSISIQINDTQETAIFDPKWTKEALYNIADNAVKYTPCGGNIQISVSAYELFCRIDVKDSGIGIPEDEQAKIFTRFYRSPKVNDIDGVGIGLYLAREIVSGQGGYIKVSSEPSMGSVFSVYLPRE